MTRCQAHFAHWCSACSITSRNWTGRLASWNSRSKHGTGFKVYNGYSTLQKRVANYKDSQQNVTGLSFSSGKW